LSQKLGEHELKTGGKVAPDLDSKC